MWTQKKLFPIPVLVLGFLLLYGCTGFETSTTPAVSGLSDNLVHVAAVTLNGNISSRTLTSPTESSSWKKVSTSTNGQFSPETAPILLRDKDVLHLFARGANNNLWTTSRSSITDWVDWTRLTEDGNVRGRFAVAQTGSTGGIVLPLDSLASHFDPLPSGDLSADSREFHVIYVSGDNTVSYSIFSNGIAQGSPFTWDGAIEGTIGTDGADHIVAVVRRPESIDIHEAVRSNTWAIQLPTTINASRGTVDVSNVVRYRGEYHFFYVFRTLGDDVSFDVRTQIRHTRFLPSPEGPSVRSFVFERSINSERKPWPVLVDYRNKLVAVYIAEGGLHYARWDNANGESFKQFPWVGRFQAGGSTFERPAVGLFPRSLTAPDQMVPNFGNDLFVAFKFPSPPFDEGSVKVRDFSQSIFRKEIDREFALFYDTADLGCTAARENPLDRIFLATERRPYISELGYLIWTLPSWVSDGGLTQIAQDLCTSGAWNESSTGGRVKPPCSEAKLPVILKPSYNIYVCQGAWNQIGHSYNNLFQEVGHYVVGSFFGFSDDGNVTPNALALPPNGPTLATYNEAMSLFSERVGGNCSNSTMDSSGRCRGFTGFSNNYDTGSIQHSFIYLWYLYFVDGDRLRRYINDDIAVGDDLLERKYNWLKDNVYRGEEFRKNNQPVVGSLP